MDEYEKPSAFQNMDHFEKRLRDATEKLIENSKDHYLLPVFREAEKEWDEALVALREHEMKRSWNEGWDMAKEALERDGYLA